MLPYLPSTTSDVEALRASECPAIRALTRPLVLTISLNDISCLFFSLGSSCTLLKGD